MVASPENARLGQSEFAAAVLVYPGGDYEAPWPSGAGSGNVVDFGGRKGFVRLAVVTGVPIVPVASVGGQETACGFLGCFQWLAKVCSLDKAVRLQEPARRPAMQMGS